jgi:four helix bundle protein
MAIERFEDIECWQLGRELSRQVFEMTCNTALKNDYSLKDQMSRSTGSVMDNVAEGFDAGSNAEFVRFLWYSKRSCTELQSQLYRALDRGYCDQRKFNETYQLAQTAKAKIGSFIAYLKAHDRP